MHKIQKTLRGRDCLRKTPELMEKLGLRHPMIVGGKTLTARLMKSVPGLLNCPVFDAYHPNPDLEDAVQGAEQFRRGGCDGLISVGGGSAMDTAKTIKALLSGASAEDVQSTLQKVTDAKDKVVSFAQSLKNFFESVKSFFDSLSSLFGKD